MHAYQILWILWYKTGQQTSTHNKSFKKKEEFFSLISSFWKKFNIWMCFTKGQFRGTYKVWRQWHIDLTMKIIEVLQQLCVLGLAVFIWDFILKHISRWFIVFFVLWMLIKVLFILSKGRFIQEAEAHKFLIQFS